MNHIAALTNEIKELRSDLKTARSAFEAAVKLIEMFRDVIPLTIDERKRVDDFTADWTPPGEPDDSGAHPHAGYPLTISRFDINSVEIDRFEIEPGVAQPVLRSIVVLNDDEEYDAVHVIREGRNAPEPPPTNNDRRAVWDLFFEYAGASVPDDMARDIVERDKAGEAKYGTRLQTFNGRDARVDAYQELLDAIVYSTQWAFEQPTVPARRAILKRFTEPLVGMAAELLREIQKEPFKT